MESTIERNWEIPRAQELREDISPQTKLDRGAIDFPTHSARSKTIPRKEFKSLNELSD